MASDKATRARPVSAPADALTALLAPYADPALPGRLVAKLDRLRYVRDRGLDATLPDGQHTGSYAIDSSEVPSWSHQFHRQPRRPELISDPDARWNGKGQGWFGYWLHGVVRVGEVGADPIPCLVERI